jgi:hypothetical protein
MPNVDHDIIATLDPRLDIEYVWEGITSVGATGFRLKTSYLALAQFSSGWKRYIHF